jgi:hypothetical protein
MKRKIKQRKNEHEWSERNKRIMVNSNEVGKETHTTKK